MKLFTSQVTAAPATQGPPEETVTSSQTSEDCQCDASNGTEFIPELKSSTDR